MKTRHNDDSRVPVRRIHLGIADLEPNWLPLPSPARLAMAGQTPAVWAGALAEIVIEAFSAQYAHSDPSLRTAAVERTEAVILDAYENLVPTAKPGDLHFLVYLDPEVQPIPVEVRQFTSVGDKADALRIMAGAEDGRAVRRPEPVPIQAERLGTGLRGAYAVKYKKSDEVVGVLNFGFRLDEHGVDLLVRAFYPDISVLMTAIDEIGALIASLSIEVLG